MRKGQIKHKPTQPDPRYKDVMITRFVNNMMLDGKKALAFKIIYKALDIVEERTKENGLEVWKKALSNIMPAVEVKSRRIGGATFQIPTEVSENRKMALGMKWMTQYAKSRSGKSMHQKLANEVMDAANGEGGAVKKKLDTHKMAEANKAFSHFRF